MNWRDRLQDTIIKSRNKKIYKQVGSWYKILRDEFDKPYMQYIAIALTNLLRTKNVTPKEPNIFRAFRECDYKDVKLVILGQDPYHTKDTANGLAFSTDQETTPESLKNIFKEVQRDIPEVELLSNDLTHWAKQGVLLLNVFLTTEQHTAKAHKDLGWHKFTERVFAELNKHSNKIVFMLWGNDAKRYKRFVTNSKHLVLETTHPSPLSAYKGFNGCSHFSKANEFIQKEYKTKIDFSTK